MFNLINIQKTIIFPQCYSCFMCYQAHSSAGALVIEIEHVAKAVHHQISTRKPTIISIRWVAREFF